MLFEDGYEREAGLINLSIINLHKATKDGFAAWDICDTPDRVARFLPVIFNTPILAGDSVMMLIHLLDINREFSGRGVGTEALKGLISDLNFGCSTFILQAAPMQFVPNSGFPDRYGISKEKATDKLKAHYRKAGFETLGDTDFMAASLVKSPAYPG